MSPKTAYLKSLIGAAKNDDAASAALIRQVCISAGYQLPISDLIRIAECIYQIGIEATEAETRSNYA